MRQLFLAYMGAILQQTGIDVLTEFVKGIGAFLDTEIAKLVDRNEEKEVDEREALQPIQIGDENAPIGTQQQPLVKNNVQLLNEAAQKYLLKVTYTDESEGESHNPTWTLTAHGTTPIPYCYQH